MPHLRILEGQAAPCGPVFAGLPASVPRLGLKPPATPVPSAMLVSALVEIAIALNGTSVARWPAPLGVASMAIDLAHRILSAFLREVLPPFGIVGVALHLVLGTAAGLGLPRFLYQRGEGTPVAGWPGRS